MDTINSELVAVSFYNGQKVFEEKLGILKKVLAASTFLKDLQYRPFGEQRLFANNRQNVGQVAVAVGDVRSTDALLGVDNALMADINIRCPRYQPGLGNKGAWRPGLLRSFPPTDRYRSAPDRWFSA